MIGGTGGGGLKRVRTVLQRPARSAEYFGPVSTGRQREIATSVSRPMWRCRYRDAEQNADLLPRAGGLSRSGDCPAWSYQGFEEKRWPGDRMYGAGGLTRRPSFVKSSREGSVGGFEELQPIAEWVLDVKAAKSRKFVIP